MAEYWKSLPRKFCDICKCWFADNKASIDFHERGKRHKENAQKRIQEIQKKGLKEMKKQKELENEMEKIERAALAAYKKDLQNMQGGNLSETVVQPTQPTNVHVNSNSDSKKKPKSFNKAKQKKPEVTIKKENVSAEEAEPLEAEPLKVWYEAQTEDGHKYYWNSETSESRWEPPEEEYISIEEQNQVKSEPDSDEQQQNSPGKIICETKDENSDTEDSPSSFGPQPKVDPYGYWVTIEEKKPVVYDLQLPKPSEDVIQVVIPMHKDDTSLKFKEKVIGQLSDTDGGDVTFKKRKFTSSSKKNARQRTTDDE